MWPRQPRFNSWCGHLCHPDRATLARARIHTPRSQRSHESCLASTTEYHVAVAQLAAHRSHHPKVGSSILSCRSSNGDARCDAALPVSWLARHSEIPSLDHHHRGYTLHRQLRIAARVRIHTRASLEPFVKRACLQTDRAPTQLDLRFSAPGIKDQLWRPARRADAATATDLPPSLPQRAASRAARRR